MHIQQIHSIFDYFKDVPLQEEFLNSYFEDVMIDVIYKGNIVDFRSLYDFIQKIPKHFNGYYRWKNLFELHVLKFADVSKLNFIFFQDDNLLDNFNYLQLVLRVGSYHHLELLYQLKKNSNLFLMYKTYEVLFENEEMEQLNHLYSIFDNHHHQNYFIMSAIQYAGHHQNLTILKYALSFINDDLTVRRTICSCISYFFQEQNYQAIIFLDKYQSLLKGVIVCNPDDYILSIIHCINTSTKSFKILDYCTGRMLAQNADALLTCLEYIKQIEFSKHDYYLCRKIYELLKCFDPALLPILNIIYQQSSYYKIIHIVEQS